MAELDLANPIFSCTGMKFWIYMATVIASLPKIIVFVALGTPSSEKIKGAKAGKIIAIGVLCVITSECFRLVQSSKGQTGLLLLTRLFFTTQYSHHCGFARSWRLPQGRSRLRGQVSPRAWDGKGIWR